MLVKSKSLLSVFSIFLIGVATSVQAVTPKCPNCGRQYQKYQWGWKPSCSCPQDRIITGAGAGIGSSEQMALDLIENMLRGALNPQNNSAASAAAYKARQEEIARKKAQEAQQALEERQRKWKNTETEFETQKKEDMDDLSCIFGDSASNDKATDSDGLADLFSVPIIELKDSGISNCDTSSLSLMDRLRCATYFSNKATEATANGDHENARYMNDQAQKAMSGQIIDEQIQLASLPDIPKAPSPYPVTNPEKLAEYENMIKVVQQDIKKLQNIELKLKETDDKIEQAEEKKHQAEQKIVEFENWAEVANTPEEKKESDDLLAQAQALLQEAESELQDATDNKEDYVNEKKSLMNKLKDIQKSIRHPAESD